MKVVTYSSEHLQPRTSLLNLPPMLIREIPFPQSSLVSLLDLQIPIHAQLVTKFHIRITLEDLLLDFVVLNSLHLNLEDGRNGDEGHSFVGALAVD